MLVNLGQADPCVTVDESIYELAKRIQWHVPALQDVTVRLGGFHRAKYFLGVIGKLGLVRYYKMLIYMARHRLKVITIKLCCCSSSIKKR